MVFIETELNLTENIVCIVIILPKMGIVNPFWVVCDKISKIGVVCLLAIFIQKRRTD